MFVSALLDATPIRGAVGGAGPWALARRLGTEAWVVCPDEAEMDRWVRALRFWRPDLRILPYPPDDGEVWDGAPRDVERARARLVARSGGGVVVAAAPALLAKVPELSPLTLRRGQIIDPASVQRWLVAHGYVATHKVDAPGTVAFRGGMLFVWGVGEARPVRVEWFDDEIESPQGPLRLLPAREGRLDQGTAERAAAYLHDVARERGVVGVDRRRMLADLNEGIWFAGIEDQLCALEPLSSVTPGAPTFLVEPARIESALRDGLGRIEDHYATLDPEEQPLVRIADRFGLPSLTGTEITALGERHAGLPDLHAGLGDVVRVTTRLRTMAEEGTAVTIVVDDATRAERVTAVFANHGLRFDKDHARPGRLGLVIGDLPQGFVAEDLAYVSADEIFGEKLRTAAPSVATKFRKAAVQSLAKLNRGDAVVHARHGIGLYRGLARMPLGEHEGDFVILEYLGGDKLYVPIHKLELVVPYTGAGEARPKLDKLGGVTWELRKSKVRDELLRFAAELLRLHARRALAVGKAYPGRDTLMAQFEERFPFVETPDQRTAIEAVLDDLAAGHPMDRLIVGDVGFGKTEVAMRAAFRVAEEGDQVVVLCPTTVLAAQHHANFVRRYRDFPVRIELLSRFRTAKDSKAVLDDLAQGRVDIVVGTHKLLARGVRFARLGLVVVDEEHRFGVKQKEDLRRLTAGVHTLAMSATPIPRTLHLALAGLRQMTLITTPPVGREAIKTDLVRFSAERVRADILGEMAREGQVFFVHNRVQSIEGVLRWLRKLVPEARIGFAHGQMDPDDLERILARFADHELDVLVTTAIIESGIDMPRVNTMIVNRADTFGLAQLYQLRGRIGRGMVRGHCTLLVGGTGSVRREAMERLRALQRHSTLGSGFALASEDLEQRGGGDILGEKQHGHIAAIGFDAYVQLLEEATHKVRGEVVRAQIEPELEVSVPAVIPEAWIPDTADRLDLYQRLAIAHDERQLDAVLRDAESDWGALPEEVSNLVGLTRLKLRCRALGVVELRVLRVRAVARLHDSTTVKTATVDALCKKSPNRFRRTGMEVEARFTPEEGAFPLRVAEWVLSAISGKA